LTETFDLDRYLRASKKVDLTGVAWDKIADHPVPVEHARCLAYMMDIESHTVIFLRDLLATRAAFEPDITAFLSCWVYEELWHGEAFSRFLGEAGFSLPPDGERVWADAPYPSRVARNTWIRRKMGSKGYFAHIGTLVGSAFSVEFPALHMTWGAVNEYATLNGYHRLIAKTEHPVLIDLLERIIKDERRHYAFYRGQAELRLQRSKAARRITRWGMENVWAPVGTGVRPQSETDFVVAYLFGDSVGLEAARLMDEKINSLPGLEGIDLYRKSVLESMDRLGSPIPGPTKPYTPERSDKSPDAKKVSEVR
jgi:rubrerythrin